MILKASQRAGGKQLALHLLNDTDNEHVEVHDMSGFVAGDLVGAMKEAYAVSKGTKCKQFLFSVSLNPPETENVDVGVFEATIERIEERNGLTGHPRAVVFHEKEGRRHAHAVWSRIDAETMTAKNLAFYKDKLRDISKQTFLENGWKLPEGYIDSAARDPRNYDLAEYQQAKRMGRDGRDLKAMMAECWAASDSKAAFTNALKERGITLAKGDKRGHVAVTHDGEILSIARYTGKKTKEVRDKLGKLDGLPSVGDAKEQAARDMGAAMVRHIAEARGQHQKAMAPLDARRQDMTRAHREERAKLDSGQKARWDKETRQRSERLNKGLRGLWDRLIGHRREVERRNIAEAQGALLRDRQQRQDLIAAQLNERRKLQGEIKTERSHHAEMLRELRTDRQRYSQQIPQQEPAIKRSRPALENVFRQSARPDMAGRLQQLREGRPKPRPARDQGREPER